MSKKAILEYLKDVAIDSVRSLFTILVVWACVLLVLRLIMWHNSTSLKAHFKSGKIEVSRFDQLPCPPPALPHKSKKQGQDPNKSKDNKDMPNLQNDTIIKHRCSMCRHRFQCHAQKNKDSPCEPRSLLRADRGRERHIDGFQRETIMIGKFPVEICNAHRQFQQAEKDREKELCCVRQVGDRYGVFCTFNCYIQAHEREAYQYVSKLNLEWNPFVGDIAVPSDNLPDKPEFKSEKPVSEKKDSTVSSATIPIPNKSRQKVNVNEPRKSGPCFKSKLLNKAVSLKRNKRK